KYAKPNQYIDFFHRLLEQVRTLPGVRAATIDNSFPLTGMTPGTDFDIAGKPARARGQERLTDVQLVGSDYFRTMRIPVLRGRTFADREETIESHVVIVSDRSEEHTSELQSRFDLVCRLLLEKKKKKKKKQKNKKKKKKKYKKKKERHNHISKLNKNQSITKTCQKKHRVQSRKPVHPLEMTSK